MRGVQAGVGSWKLLVWNTERRCRLVRTPGSQPLLDPTAAPSVSQSRFCLRVEGNFSHFREMCQHLMKCLLSHLAAAGVVVQTCHTWPRDHVTPHQAGLTWALRHATLSCSSRIRSVSVTEAVRSSSVLSSWFWKYTSFMAPSKKVFSWILLILQRKLSEVHWCIIPIVEDNWLKEDYWLLLHLLLNAADKTGTECQCDVWQSY